MQTWWKLLGLTIAMNPCVSSSLLPSRAAQSPQLHKREAPLLWGAAWFGDLSPDRWLHLALSGLQDHIDTDVIMNA